MKRLLVVFFVTPLIEMYLLIEVGGWIGALPTIGLVVLTAVIGVFLLRVQGLTTLGRGIAKLQSGVMPAAEMVEGFLLAVAGALLLTPGFVTDGFGFCLLTPPLRVAIARLIIGRVRIDAVQGFHARTHETNAREGRVIEGHAEEKAAVEKPDREG